LSGEPLRQRSTQIVRQISRLTGGRLTIIGVGGVMSAAHVQEKLDAGASLVQIYTGLVYKGPGLVRQILTEY
jgi:dihydroorotate dehydrogenase